MAKREGEVCTSDTRASLLMGKDAAYRLNKVCYYKMGYAALEFDDPAANGELRGAQLVTCPTVCVPPLLCRRMTRRNYNHLSTSTSTKCQRRKRRVVVVVIGFLCRPIRLKSTTIIRLRGNPSFLYARLLQFFFSLLI